MKKTLLVVLLVVLMTASMAAVVSASPTDAPQGACPAGVEWHLHKVSHHTGDHAGHKHVGNDRDLNGDGYICGKHVGADGNVHVHIDNNVPLRDE